MRKNVSLMVAFLLGAAFGRAVFSEAGHLVNQIVFGKRNR